MIGGKLHKHLLYEFRIPNVSFNTRCWTLGLKYKSVAVDSIERCLSSSSPCSYKIDSSLKKLRFLSCRQSRLPRAHLTYFNGRVLVS